MGIDAALEKFGGVRWKPQGNYHGVDCKSITREDAYVLYGVTVGRQPKVIFETGTGPGLGSMVLGLAAKQYGGKVYTCDAQKNLCTASVERINEDFGLEVTAIPGSSTVITPPDNIELFFHDSNHAFKPMVAEFKRVQPWLAEDHILLYHDYTNKGTQINQAVEWLIEEYGYHMTVLGFGRGIAALEL